MRSFRFRFGIRHLIVLTTASAFAVFAFTAWSGPSLEDRMVQAAQRGDSRMFAVFIALGAQVDRGQGIGGYSPTPLMDAAYDGDLRAVDLYLQHGAYVNYEEKDGFTPINYAAMQGNWDVVLRLHQAGADCGHRDATGANAIDYAIHGERPDIAQALKTSSTARDFTRVRK
jgi:hypothetical protein